MRAKKKLTILLSEDHGLRFNSPRESRHQLMWKWFPHDWKWRPLDGLALWNPLEYFDLIHSFNKIPLTRKPWVITFESILPRTIGKGERILRLVLRERLLEENCYKIIAISEYARRKFAFFNRGWSGLEQATRKLEVLYPNLPLRARRPKSYAAGELSLIFVGNLFAHKGGVAAIRFAKKAKERRLPVRLHVISSLQYSDYTDCPDRSRYNRDIELLELDNVAFHGSLPNSEVIRLMGESQFQLLPTLDDTFGFSVLEGFSTGTPCIATAVCALPEIVKPGANGHLLSMPTDENGNWKYLRQRNWEILDATYTRLANETLDWIEAFLDSPGQYEALSAGAIEQVRQHHDATLASQRLDAIYSAAIRKPSE